MTNFNPITGEDDQATIGMLMEHIETPMRTLIALEFVCNETFDDDRKAQDVMTAASEDGVVDLVTSALALITASWEQAGADFKIGDEDGTPPEVDEWCSNILTHALAHAKARWVILRIDYALNVRPLPRPKGTKS